MASALFHFLRFSTPPRTAATRTLSERQPDSWMLRRRNCVIVLNSASTPLTSCDSAPHPDLVCEDS